VAIVTEGPGGRSGDRQELLERVPLFAGISAAGLEELGAIADEMEVRAGTVLTHEGYREGFFFIVMEGTVRIERGGQTINTIGPGDFLGEIALLDGGPRTATAVTETPCRLLSMTYQMFHELLDASPEVRAEILRAVGGRLRAVDEASPV
jgi:CRP/FNR family cyclic AMP-dependent transcriptional regulator